MKFLAPAVLSGVIVISIFTGCKKESSDTPLQQKLIGKWNMQTAIGSYTMQGSKKLDTTRFTAADYIELKANGTVTINESDTRYTGMWNIIDGKLHIARTGYMDYANGFDLPVVESKRLQLYYAENSAISFMEQKLNLSK